MKKRCQILEINNDKIKVKHIKTGDEGYFFKDDNQKLDFNKLKINDEIKGIIIRTIKKDNNKIHHLQVLDEILIK